MSLLYKSDNVEQFKGKQVEKPELLNHHLDFLLHAASRHVTRIFKSHLEEHDLTYTQYLVFLVLNPDVPSSVEEIGEKLYLDSGTLTPLLKRLEAKNFLRRVRALEDERKLDISLTDAGKILQLKLLNLSNDIYEQLSLGSSLQAINMLLSKLISLFQRNTVKHT
jgi:MarR family transcriptional regulator, organic hydroperoxide resistance regulator